MKPPAARVRIQTFRGEVAPDDRCPPQSIIRLFSAALLVSVVPDGANAPVVTVVKMLGAAKLQAISHIWAGGALLRFAVKELVQSSNTGRSQCFSPLRWKSPGDSFTVPKHFNVMRGGAELIKRSKACEGVG